MFFSGAEPKAEWPSPSSCDGQRPRWRLKHERHDVGARPSQRLGFVGRCDWRFGLELQLDLKIYRRIEDWHGVPDRERRGVGGPVFVQAVPNPPLIALAFKDAAKSCGIPCYADANGEMMELERGCALLNVTVRGSRRVSIFRSYTGDVADKPNLTVLHDATVTRLLCRGKRVTGVEFSCDGETYTANAGLQVVVSLGAINTPKLLMQSWIGPDEELKRHGIPVLQHLPGVGQNFQDHFNVAGSLREAKEPLPFGANGGGATAFWNGDTKVDTPNFQLIQALIPYVSDDARKIDLPRNTWSILPIVLQPESRGWIRLTGPNPSDGLEIDAIELVPFSAITARDVGRAGEPDRETLRRRAAHAGQIDEDTLVYRIEFHAVSAEGER